MLNLMSISHAHAHAHTRNPLHMLLCGSSVWEQDEIMPAEGCGAALRGASQVRAVPHGLTSVIHSAPP